MSRAIFEAMAYTGPVVRADAIVILTGDGLTRVPAAFGYFVQGVAPAIVVSGGVQDPPYAIDANRVVGSLIGQGLHRDKLFVENESQHTRESAEKVIDMAQANGWGSLFVVTSAYHLPRAMLTFIKVLEERDLAHIYVTVEAAFSRWSEVPDGLDVDRAALVEIEAEKVARYQEKGDVASYADGIEYMRRWEVRWDAR